MSVSLLLLIGWVGLATLPGVPAHPSPFGALHAARQAPGAKCKARQARAHLVEDKEHVDEHGDEDERRQRTEGGLG